MHNKVKNTKQGFTLIELSLSIVFIAVLSLTMVMMINESISAYRRGMTLNRLNTTGMDLVDDMRTAVQNSVSRSVVDLCESYYNQSSNLTVKERCQKDGGQKFVSVTKTARVKVGGRWLDDSVPVYGAFCTGSYSYIWNSGYFYGADYDVEGVSRAALTYTDSKGKVGRATDFRVLKVEDKARRVCTVETRPDDNVYRDSDTDYSNEFDISGYEALSEDPIELLSDNAESNLAFYGLSAARPATSNAQRDMFYAISFILGTTQGGINVAASGNFCATPEGYEEIENFDYCAINKFNFAAQAIGG